MGPGARSARPGLRTRFGNPPTATLTMETSTMFSRFMPLALIRASVDHWATPEGRRSRPALRTNRNRTRARFQLEGLEERCLLSGISGITEFAVPSVAANQQSIVSGPD